MLDRNFQRLVSQDCILQRIFLLRIYSDFHQNPNDMVRRMLIFLVAWITKKHIDVDLPLSVVRNRYILILLHLQIFCFREYWQPKIKYLLIFTKILLVNYKTAKWNVYNNNFCGVSGNIMFRPLNLVIISYQDNNLFFFKTNFIFWIVVIYIFNYTVLQQRAKIMR